MAKRVPADSHLLEALVEAYSARALLFHRGVRASGIDLLIAEIDRIASRGLTWKCAEYGISQKAFKRLRDSGGKPQHVFVHPDLIKQAPRVIAYYRNMATISQKGIGQLVVSTKGFEDGRKNEMSDVEATRLATVLNRIISRVIEEMGAYNVEVSRQAILAEIGAQLQGSWANTAGQGAARAVERLLADHVRRERLGSKTAAGHYMLNNGWQIVFGTEPDVAFFDDAGVKTIAIEIKGSLDVAGAQTRYGEAKKSFAKQIHHNPRCHTVYLASCYTDAVIEQIEADAQVRDWFNLTSILYDEEERRHFLSRLFHIVNTPSR